MTGKAYVPGEATQTFVSNMSSLRKQCGITYATLSRLLHKRGQDIPPLGLRRIEQGTRFVRLDEAIALADIFGVDLKVMYESEAAPKQKEAFLSWLLAETQHVSSVQT